MSEQKFQMREMVECVLCLHDFFQDMDKVSAWMMIKNPHLGNVSPWDLFERGRGHKVLSFVKGALEENQL